MFRRILILSSICIFNGSSRIDNQEKAFSWLTTDNNRLIKLIYVKGEIKKDAIRDCDIAWRGLRECLLIDSNPPRGHQCPCIIWGLYTHHWFCMLLILLYYGGNITHYFSNASIFLPESWNLTEKSSISRQKEGRSSNRTWRDDVLAGFPGHRNGRL